MDISDASTNETFPNDSGGSLSNLPSFALFIIPLITVISLVGFLVAVFMSLKKVPTLTQRIQQQTNENLEVSPSPVASAALHNTYENPFESKTQYTNPFDDKQNPFDSLSE